MANIEKDFGKTRQVYSAPVLRKYGSLQSLTRTLGNMGKDDGGATTGKMKTNA